MKQTRLLILLALAGCARLRPGAAPRAADGGSARSSEVTVAPGVVYRAFAEGGPVSGASEAAVLDADLRAPGVRVKILADSTAVAQGRVFGDSYTVREWCRRADALGGVNGGYFGVTADDPPGATVRKEVIGLLATDGVVRSSGRLVRSPSHPDRRFARCVFGVDSKGTPCIGWAVGQRGRGALLTDYGNPLNPTSQRFWEVTCAVACGPRLIERGEERVTDREERLVSPPALRRTFLGYDVDSAGKPRHLVLAVGLSMTFRDAAAFLRRYFQTYHGTACHDAMCLDGGSSTQLAYRVPTGWQDACWSPVTVPTAVVITK